MKTIVVGYNESDPSDRAIARAGETGSALRRATRGHERHPSSDQRWDGIDDGSDLRKAGSLLEKMGIEAELVEAVGDPAEAIVEVAEAHNADLIVVGTREPSMIERLLGHSVSEAVQRRAHCDVLIVH